MPIRHSRRKSGTLAQADHDFLRLDARPALAQGDRRRAGEILERPRRLAGEAWNAGDGALLARTRG